MARGRAFLASPASYLRNGLAARYRRWVRDPLTSVARRLRKRREWWPVYRRSQVERARTMLPSGYDRGLRGRFTVVSGTAVMLLLDLNQKLIDRYCRPPDVWDNDRFDWIPRIEAAYPEIRAELEAYLVKIHALPHVAEISGYDRLSEDGRWSNPGVEGGDWRSTMIWRMGRWLEPAADFPAAKRAMAGIDGVGGAGFIGLDAHGHVLDHVDPNRGALHYQLGVIVPGDDGACRIRVGEQMHTWREGESLVFDLAARHEVWNDADSPRILFMMEFNAPLRFPFSRTNQFTQWAYHRFFPTFQGMDDRIGQLHHDRTAA